MFDAAMKSRMLATLNQSRIVLGNPNLTKEQFEQLKSLVTPFLISIYDLEFTRDEAAFCHEVMQSLEQLGNAFHLKGCNSYAESCYDKAIDFIDPNNKLTLVNFYLNAVIVAIHGKNIESIKEYTRQIIDIASRLTYTAEQRFWCLEKSRFFYKMAIKFFQSMDLDMVNIGIDFCKIAIGLMDPINKLEIASYYLQLTIIYIAQKNKAEDMAMKIAVEYAGDTDLDTYVRSNPEWCKHKKHAVEKKGEAINALQIIFNLSKDFRYSSDNQQWCRQIYARIMFVATHFISESADFRTAAILYKLATYLVDSDLRARDLSYTCLVRTLKAMGTEELSASQQEVLEKHLAQERGKSATMNGTDMRWLERLPILPLSKEKPDQYKMQISEYICEPICIPNTSTRATEVASARATVAAPVATAVGAAVAVRYAGATLNAGTQLDHDCVMTARASGSASKASIG